MSFINTFKTYLNPNIDIVQNFEYIKNYVIITFVLAMISSIMPIFTIPCALIMAIIPIYVSGYTIFSIANFVDTEKPIEFGTNIWDCILLGIIYVLYCIILCLPIITIPFVIVLFPVIMSHFAKLLKENDMYVDLSILKGGFNFSEMKNLFNGSTLLYSIITYCGTFIILLFTMLILITALAYIAIPYSIVGNTYALIFTNAIATFVDSIWGAIITLITIGCVGRYYNQIIPKYDDVISDGSEIIESLNLPTDQNGGIIEEIIEEPIDIPDESESDKLNDIDK